MSFLVERKTNGKRRAPGVLLGKTEGGILLKKENSGAEHSEMMIVDEKNIVFLQQDKMIRLFFGDTVSRFGPFCPSTVAGSIRRSELKCRPVHSGRTRSTFFSRAFFECRRRLSCGEKKHDMPCRLSAGKHDMKFKKRERSTSGDGALRVRGGGRKDVRRGSSASFLQDRPECLRRAEDAAPRHRRNISRGCPCPE